MGVLQRLIAVVVTLAVMGASTAIGDAVGLPIPQAVPLGLFLAGVLAASLNYLLDDGADNVIAGVAFVMLFIAALGAIAAGKETWPQANAFLLFAGAVVIEGLAIALVRFVATTVMQAVVRPRRTRRRRRVAAEHGWRYEPADPDLPSVLGGAEHLVLQIPAWGASTGTRPVPQEAGASDIVRGEANGVGFVAFDFFVPRRLQQPVVTTAWVVRLPHALPLLTSGEVVGGTTDGLPTSPLTSPGSTDSDVRTVVDNFFGAPGRDAAHGPVDTDPANAPSGAGGNRPAVAGDTQPLRDPEFARAVATDDVIALTRERLPSWWVEGTLLASTVRDGQGAPPDLLVANIEAITWLATVLGSPPMSRWADASDHREPHRS